MDDWLLYIMILAAIGIGWLLGSRDITKKSKPPGAKYYNGLNYLLSEEPDRAVAIFIEDLEVNQETLETHLALGGLLRRRGELEKAVIVHENILTQAQLGKDTMLKVKLELARDYLLAGILDRAEELSLMLSEEDGETRQEGRKITLEIYEQEREWQQAIEVAQLLAVGADSEKYEKVISHYYCEIAEELLDSGKIESAREAIREAIGHSPVNARASLIHGKIDIAEGRYPDAVTALTRIKDQEPVYVPESLELLISAFEKSDMSRQELREYLEACLEVVPSISVVLTLASSMREEIGDEATAKYIAEHLKKNPTIRGLTRLVDMHVDNTSGIARQNLTILRSFAEALVADKPAYRCQSCGSEGKKMFWHCAVCKNWATIKPIFGLEGE
ncbi:MAG: lipopolysaccharide assembly protein LapB [Gammaproteobacteria bacterium]|nr:lipopolysaccharide assembly protein LapB [Gammaproteobacteria bacterium]